MSFMRVPVVVRRAALAAVLAAAIAGCSKPKEKDAAVQELPGISTTAEVKAALSRAGSRMLVIDFYADWCKPCRALAPVIRDLAGEYQGKADFYRANIDGNAELTEAFGIRGIPYVVFMKNDSVVYALTGLNPKEYYAKILLICEGAVSAADCMARLNKEQ